MDAFAVSDLALVMPTVAQSLGLWQSGEAAPQLAELVVALSLATDCFSGRIIQP